MQYLPPIACDTCVTPVYLSREELGSLCSLARKLFWGGGDGAIALL